MRSLAILISGALIAGALLYSDRFMVWQEDAGRRFVIHDTWTGSAQVCRITSLSPEAKVDCSTVQLPFGLLERFWLFRNP